MVESRWLLRLGPPIALGAAVLLASTSAGASDQPWHPPDCPRGSSALSAAVRIPPPPSPTALRGEAWFRLDPRLDADGALAGQRLEIGLLGGAAAHLDLAAESFAAGPFGRVVLVGSDDGSTSVLHAVERSADCAWPIAREASVIRRATIDPAGQSVFEFRVDRASREDLGVWRRQLDGGSPVRVLPPLAADARLGQVFSTELAWSADGRRLAVQSCGSINCRTRLLDVDSGLVRDVAGDGQGELIGVTGDRLVAYQVCDRLPCPIVATDVASGRATTLVEAARFARMVPTPLGTRLVAESIEAADRRIRVIDPASGNERSLPLAAALSLVPAPARSWSGARMPDGWIALAGDGRTLDADAVLEPLDGGTPARLDEVIR